MKPPNGRKIVHRFNSELQPVGYEAGILSGILRLLGSDCTKFPICEKNWRKVRTKDKEKCKKNTENQSTQLYTHIGSSKSFARLGEEEETIEAIEQRDESSKLLSHNDSLA
ncbi:hypothetical protein Ahy_A09g044766 [Arachis hypogaea]|uniref:Uncharacterized protein n=1 Tax=Arachis hypogaea TaxID=3818 RepID=A0A445BKP7_ARAHY|nr:hypothetical protein Ahy_A09g044766 [Arachis hypogaea]